MIVALAGGVGGAKLALGLSRVLAPERLAIVVNTGDDFEHLGLHISPDLDTVTYTLAGIADPAAGWGIAGETWSFMEALDKLGGETWFQLGDRDLATHVERTRRLAAGHTLSGVTAWLGSRLGIAHPILPMSDDRVRTVVLSGSERLGFQDYFVRRRCEPRLDGLVYEGAETATPSASLLHLINGDIDGVVICPSNPYLSVAPILAIPAIRQWLENRSFPVVAVSPIIAGEAVKGPAAKIMRELDQAVSPVSIGAYYAGLVDCLVIDEADAACADAIAALGITPALGAIYMRDLQDRERLALQCVSLLGP